MRMSYQKPYTFEERKRVRTLKRELQHLFTYADDKEVEDFLNGYMAEVKEIVPLLRTLLEFSKTTLN